MKKMYIVVQSRLSIHKVCTDDLSKMYYFQKKVSPALPVYIDDHDIDDQSKESFMTKSIETDYGSLSENVSI